MYEPRLDNPLSPTFQPLMDALQVKMIMTPKKDFVYYEDCENLENCEYDVLPCKDLKHYYDTKAKEKKHILAEDVISADMCLLDLIDLFDEKHTVYFVKEGADIVGLVHYSDLKKHPVRVLCYLMVSEIELKFRGLLKERYSERRDELRDILSETLDCSVWSKLQCLKKKDEKNGQDLTYVDYLYFSNFFEIFKKQKDLLDTLGLDSDELDSLKKSLKPVRNWAAHPAREEPPITGKIYKVLKEFKESYLKLTKHHLDSALKKV